MFLRGRGSGLASSEEVDLTFYLLSLWINLMRTSGDLKTTFLFWEGLLFLEWRDCAGGCRLIFLWALRWMRINFFTLAYFDSILYL